MAMHDYHPGLDGYKEQAVLQDGCAECEHRASQGLEAFNWIDRENALTLYELARNLPYADRLRERHSELDLKLAGDLGLAMRALRACGARIEDPAGAVVITE